jgi:hypothetical protein
MNRAAGALWSKSGFLERIFSKNANDLGLILLVLRGRVLILPRRAIMLA